MNGFNNYHQETDVNGFNAYLSKVFSWMFIGLGLSFITAYYVSNSVRLLSLIFGNVFIFFGLFIGEIILVAVISRNVTKYSYGTASLLFMLYSFINGLTLSYIFKAYKLGTISTAFVSAAALFGVMAVYGKVTKKDLTEWGSILKMGLYGLIIAIIINVFLGSDALDFVISGVGIFVFAGITAWDIQKLKSYYFSHGDTGVANNIAIMGALSLYLDFINIFIFLLRIFGRRN